MRVGELLRILPLENLTKKPSWYVGLAFGAVGLVYMINGFTLFLSNMFPQLF